MAAFFVAPPDRMIACGGHAEALARKPRRADPGLLRIVLFFASVQSIVV
jgi:hypothetical protein